MIYISGKPVHNNTNPVISKSPIAILLFLLVSVNVTGQNPSATRIQDLRDKRNTEWLLNGQVEEIKGSPYLYDEFISGEILLLDSTIYSGMKLNYNIFNDEIEYEKSGIHYTLIDKQQVDRITIGNDTFIIDKYNTNQNKMNGYLMVFAEGDVRLFSKLDMELTDRVPAKPMQDPIPRTFKRKTDTYYLLKGENELYKISSVKKLIQYLEVHQEELSIFAKTEKISARDPGELSELVDYYNSLNKMMLANLTSN
jgi:hypothetical protein